MAPSKALMGERTDLHNNVEPPKNPPDLDAKWRIEDLQFMHEYLASQLDKAKKAMRTQYNKKHLECTFCVGDWVMLYTLNLNTGCPLQKLDDKQIGPFQIYTPVG